MRQAGREGGRETGRERVREGDSSLEFDAHGGMEISGAGPPVMLVF